MRGTELEPITLVSQFDRSHPHEFRHCRLRVGTGSHEPRRGFRFQDGGSARRGSLQLLIDFFCSLEFKIGQGVDFNRLFHCCLGFCVGHIDQIPDRKRSVGWRHYGSIQGPIIGRNLRHHFWIPREQALLEPLWHGKGGTGYGRLKKLPHLYKRALELKRHVLRLGNRSERKYYLLLEVRRLLLALLNGTQWR